ncbi:uncharacterized protein LOC132184688 [Corylus avellana]|uniref:uncharacterized protein LOC132184688 n=1 Tax=Corylus avellana TaxID=13451 RepID=UPI00286D100F|nr:uncharacterized protein LOC132184688 [Corylus avellana]
MRPSGLLRINLCLCSVNIRKPMVLTIRSHQKAMELDKPSDHQHKDEETHHLSGAYIRSLVKQIASSRTKHPMNPKEPQNLTELGEGCVETHQAQQPRQPQQHKKQVRRRLHASRPYKERLLNMAEARREIATALKYHREAMKQASQQQMQQTQLQQQPHPCFDHQEEEMMKSRRNSRVYPSSIANFSQYLDNFSAETLNFTLPNQPLGLNLNLHDFNFPSLYSSSSSPSSSPSSLFPNLSAAADQENPSVAISQQEVAAGGSEGSLHAAMDDAEMAEIRSVGEQHQMEWNDIMNLEFPAWLNANDQSYLQHHLNDYCSEDYFQDLALPRMEIGEIEGMDGEWLA